MTFLPIVDRELQVAARRKSTYNMRMIAVFLALGVSIWCMASFSGNPFVSVNVKGRILFQAISVIAFVYCLLLGVPLASDCISQEKREGTLGFLFLTSLKSHDVVWGKLAGASVNAVYCLVAILPILALPLQFGGVTGKDVVFVSLTLLNTLFFSLSCGLFVSAISRDERRAMFAAFLLIGTMTLGPFFLTIAVNNRNLQQFLMALSPAFFITRGVLGGSMGPMGGAMGAISAPMRALLDTLPLVSAVFIHVSAWIMLLWASRILGRIWHEQTKKSWLHRGLEKVDQIGYGNSSQRQIHRRGLLSQNPFVWLASRDRWKVRYVWILAASCFAIWLWSFLFYGQVAFSEEVVFGTIFFLNAFVKVWVASEVCYRMIDDRRTGALELLLSTPMTCRDYLLGIGQALLRQFGLPLLLLVIGQYFLICKAYEPVVARLYLLMMPIDIAAMAVAAMLFGLTSKNTTRSLLGAVASVCFAPYVFIVLISPFLDANGGRTPFVAQLWLWFVLGLLNNFIVVGLWGSRRLWECSKSAAAFHAASSMEKIQ